MATQRVYSYSLVGFLVLALLVVLGAAGCGNSSATKQHAIGADNQVPGMVGSEGMTYAEDDAERICDEPTGEEYEGSMPMGYREPGYSDTRETGTVTDDEYSPGRTEDMDDESSGAAATSMTCYDEERASTEATEECEIVEEDDSTYCEEAWTPPVTEEEGTSPTDNAEEGYSGTVAPWISGEDETPTDPNLDDTTSDTVDDSSDTPVGEFGSDLGSEPSP